MEKNKTILENAKRFIKKYYDCFLLFILVTWSGYVEYQYLYSNDKWSYIPCILRNINYSVVHNISLQYYKLIGPTPFIVDLVSSYIIFLGMYLILKVLYKKIKIIWLKFVLLILFYLYILLAVLDLYISCRVLTFH